MKRFPILLGLSLTFAACGTENTSVTVTSTGQTVEPPKTAPAEVPLKGFSHEAFSIMAPDNWDTNPPGYEKTPFISFAPKDNDADAFRENVNVLVQNVSGTGLTLEQFTLLNEEDLKANAKSLEVLASVKADMNGIACQQMHFRADDGNGLLDFRQMYVVTKDRAYTITFTSDPAVAESYSVIRGRIFASFKPVI